MNDQVSVHAGGITFEGRDAVRLFQAVSLRSGIKLYQKTKIRPNKAWTPTAMLTLAGRICGKTYRRGQFQEAIDDLTIWIETMKSAMPVV